MKRSSGAGHRETALQSRRGSPEDRRGRPPEPGGGRVTGHERYPVPGKATDTCDRSRRRDE